MPEATLAAWMSLYAAVGILAALCSIIAGAATIYELRTGLISISFTTLKSSALALPKLWLRWQINYLKGAPVVMLITLTFAHQLGFSLLANV